MNSSDLPNPSTYYSIDKSNESFKSNSFSGPIYCDLCDIWVHKKCNRINDATYMLKNDETKWFCIECSKEIFPH